MFDVGVAIVSDVGRDLHRIDVIGEKATPRLAEASSRHASSGEEF
jgi:hypothetical protein